MPRDVRATPPHPAVGPERRAPITAPRAWGVFWRGAAMGMADVVPGVSGGTMALVLGVYPRLIAALAALTGRPTWRAIVDRRWRAAWTVVDGFFLTTLVAGIAVAVVALAGVIEAALTSYRPWVYSAFFGLIAASTVVVVRQVRHRGAPQLLAFGLTAAAAFVLVGLTPVTMPDATWFLVLSGAIGICALVLPGVSGAFLLVLLGQYERVLGAIARFDLAVLAPFAIGAAVGLLGFARLLAALLRRYPSTTHAVLAGFLVGSLRRVWPWQGDDAFRLVLTGPPDAIAGVAAAVLALLAATAVLTLDAWGRRRA